jgi:hypothetical protein
LICNWIQRCAQKNSIFLGFLEGCFYLRIIKGSRLKLDCQLCLLFQIKLHIQELELLKGFLAFFGVGMLYTYGTTPPPLIFFAYPNGICCSGCNTTYYFKKLFLFFIKNKNYSVAPARYARGRYVTRGGKNMIL